VKLPVVILAAIACAVSSLHAADTYKLTLWNQHNGDNGERGTTACKIEALKDGKVVWKNDKFKLLWRLKQDTKGTVSIPLPPTSPGIDEIKVTVIEWVQLGGGLSEIQVFKNDKDITDQCTVTVSAALDNRYGADKLTDKITTSKTKDVGYWLLPDKTPGMIDIKLP